MRRVADVVGADGDELHASQISASNHLPGVYLPAAASAAEATVAGPSAFVV